MTTRNSINPTAIGYSNLVGADHNEWHQLSPLPDGQGYGGMLAGTLDGKLVAGGGSRFDKPLWLDGEKYYSDVIYFMEPAEQGWSVSSTKLPHPMGHAAYGQFADGIIIAGGTTSDGSTDQVLFLQYDSHQFKIETLPSLPKALAYAAGAAAGDYFYIVGGTDGLTQNSNSSECWRLDLIEREAWERMPDLPGEAPLIPSASTNGKDIFVFGGISYRYNTDGEAVPSPLSQAFRFDTETLNWVQLADIPEPRVAPVASPALNPDGLIWLFGGYAEVHKGDQASHPGFVTETFLYDPARDSWQAGSPLPTQAVASRNEAVINLPLPMIAAPAVIWKDSLIIIGGEVLPSVRTGCVQMYPLPLEASN